MMIEINVKKFMNAPRYWNCNSLTNRPNRRRLRHVLSTSRSGWFHATNDYKTKPCLDEAAQETTASVVETSGSIDEPPSPEGRLQPEDLSVTAKIKDIRDTAESLPPLKTPELKLSVRKLLGCTPSPPPISRDQSPSPENCVELKSQSSNDSKTLVSSNDHAKVSSQVTRSSGQSQEDSVKGERNSERILILCWFFMCIACKNNTTAFLQR